MRKICPICHREQQDEKLIVCEICKEPFISIGDGLRLLSKEEIAALASAIFKDWRIRLLLKAFPLIVVVGVAGAVIFLNWSAAKRLKVATAEIERTASNEVAQALSLATNQLAHQFRIFALDASNQVAEAYSSVTNQIAEEFQTPRIKQTVESVAKDEAKSILEAEVQPAVTSFKENALFMRTIARAQGYDFKAYQALLEIGRGTNENAKLANQVLDELDRSLARDRSEFTPKRHFVTFSETNFYKGPFTSDELAVRFEFVADNKVSFNREGFVNTVNDLKQPLFLGSLVKLFTNETDLGVADRLSIAISSVTKEDFHPRDFERVQSWWASHQNECTNWPVSEFNAGQIEFATGRFSEALESFQNVLSLDSSADQSRAFAIACSLQTGNTNSATELLKGFKHPDARWAQWATAFAELHTGSASNATVRFAELTKRQPLMSPLPTPEAKGWVKIDWPLFNKLISSDKP